MKINYLVEIGQLHRTYMFRSGKIYAVWTGARGEKTFKSPPNYIQSLYHRCKQRPHHTFVDKYILKCYCQEQWSHNQANNLYKHFFQDKLIYAGSLPDVILLLDQLQVT